MTYALITVADGDVTKAETVTELVDGLLEGHAEADDADRLTMRLDALALAAGRAQAIVLADLGVEGLDEDALTILLHERESQVVEFERWDSTIPLFLMATGYTPFTDTPRPEGDTIVWLDPSTERTFLDGLQALGIAELLVSE